jgi:carbamoyl-phosphate synthase large subunit
VPRRNDIKKILIVGAGPIVIGQACEFDYSGSQACKVLRNEGYKVVLLNSNPATIMTDPDMADRIYIEPVTADTVEKIVKKEKPDAILPTLGGQTALNVTVEADKRGIFKKYNVEVIGANIKSIKKAEDRELFRRAMKKIGLDMPKSAKADSLKEAQEVADRIGYPVIIRPAFTLGGRGGGIANNREEFREIAKGGLDASMINEILVEESICGWKEYEMEVMRDENDNVVIICSIENFDAMGVHTGDSITVAPIQTLTDKEYQLMRDASIKCIREIGVETGGSNIQFAINPKNGRMIVIEMNPRVSRSSALASKATGFPIAKIAAKLAVGYTLDEIPNDITKKTPSCFEPTIDYCVVKIPRFTFEKFKETNDTLTSSMKSIGETMAIGRTFKESLQKALRSLETGVSGLVDIEEDVSKKDLLTLLSRPNCQRIFYIKKAFKEDLSIDDVYEYTKIDKWFLANMLDIVKMEKKILKNKKKKGKALVDIIKEAKRFGFSDKQLAALLTKTEVWVYNFRMKHNIRPVFKLVDTCAAEFEAYTPYYYSTYE